MASVRSLGRGVAQPGSASHWGCGGRRFESSRPDQIFRRAPAAIASAIATTPNCSAESLITATLKTVKRGSLVYTDKWSGYDTLTFCGYRHLKVDHGVEFARGKVHINGLEGFWSYAKAKFSKHHGVSPAKFPLYLYEWQYRYNHRQADLFDLLLDLSLTVVPDL